MRAFNRLILIATLLAFCVVVLGAYVRLSDAGLGCPDWPGCYGSLSVPQSESAIAHAQIAYPDKPIEAHKAWKEMLHRYLAGTLGLLILAIFVLGWRKRHEIKVSPLAANVIADFSDIPGSTRYVDGDAIAQARGSHSSPLGGMGTLALLVWMTHRHWGTVSARFLPSGSLRFWVRGALVILFLQIFLGGWTSTNYAALACTDFPTCHGVWFPDMDFANAFHWIRELGEDANGQALQLSRVYCHSMDASYRGARYIYLPWLDRFAFIKTAAIKEVGALLADIADRANWFRDCEFGVAPFPLCWQ